MLRHICLLLPHHLSGKTPIMATSISSFISFLCVTCRDLPALAGRVRCVEPIATRAKNGQNYGLRQSIPPELWTSGIHTSNPYLFCTGSSIVHFVQIVHFRDDGKIQVMPNNCNKHVITSVHLQYICTSVLMQTLIMDNCVSYI
jgi:hypothetical protein